MVPLLVGAATQPPPPLAEGRGDLDGDGRQDQARLERDGTLIIVGGDGKELGRARLDDAGRMRGAQVSFVAVEDRVVVHARAELGRGQASEAVLGRDGQVIFKGRTGPSGDGDRGERLRVDEAGVVRYQTAPGVQRCDGNDLLFPERWDFAGRRFRPVLVAPPAGPALHATSTAPAGLSGPPLGLFRFVAASIDASGQRRADMLGAPRELDDGSITTLWHAGEGGAAEGAWVTARAEAGPTRVRAVAIVSGPRPPASLSIVLGPGSDQTFRLALTPGKQWVALPPTAPTACISFVVERAQAGDNTLAEIAIFSDVEGAEGLQRLVTAVAELRPDVDGAARLLVARGGEAAAAIARALPTAQGQGRHRLIQVLAEIRSPASAPALGKALETAAPDDREPLVAALGQLGEKGLGEARRILEDKSQSAEARADALTVLGDIAVADAQQVPTAIDLLLAAAGNGEPGLRLAAMKALARATAEAKGASGRIAAALPARLGQHEFVGDVARALAQGAARLPVAERGAVAAALEQAWPEGRDDFALRLRLIRAIATLGEARLLPALKAAGDDRDPVLRAEAVGAAASLPDGLALAVAHLGDGDAGVRRAAATALAAHPSASALPLLTRALQADSWPMVRHAAADGLGAGCAQKLWPAPPSLSRAVVGEGKSMSGADAAEEVRRAALAALGRCPDAPFATLAAALGERRQPAAVRELAAALVAKRGGVEAAHALARALQDVLADPAADERFAAIATAITRAIGRTGDTSRPTLEALGAAANEPLSPAVRAAAMESIGRLCPDGAGEALRKGAADGEGSVARVARAALERCKR
jgi:HEAT repeat protein